MLSELVRRVFRRERFDVEQLADEVAACDCCASTTRSVCGLVHDRQRRRTVASYVLRWRVAHLPERGVSVSVVIGEFGDASTAQDRALVQLRYGWCDDRSIAFTVDDADLEGHADLAGSALRRNDVVGTPLAATTFDVLDAIWVQDSRLDELRDRSRWVPDGTKLDA